MWYKNIAGRFFGLVTKHACDTHMDGRTDRQTDRRTELQFPRPRDCKNLSEEEINYYTCVT